MTGVGLRGRGVLAISLVGAVCLGAAWSSEEALGDMGHDTAAHGSGAPDARVAVNRGLPAEEPPEYDVRELKAYYDWRNDLFFRLFDLHDRGTADFMTARRTYRVWLDEFGTPIAVTMPHPLFYWVDLNNNGEFEPGRGEMWSDPEEDGLNGNERPYDVSDLQSRSPGASPGVVPHGWQHHRSPGGLSR